MEVLEKSRKGWMLAGLLGLAVLGFVVVQSGGVRASRQMVGWWGASVHRKLFPEQEAGGAAYAETAKSPLSLAIMIGQFRVAWPGESAATVHGAVDEVVTDLLHHGDIEVGDLEGGKFVAWPMRPWAAEEKIRAELLAQRNFFADERHIVFRRKAASTP